MLTYACPTCGNKFEAQVGSNRVTYMHGNRIVELPSENSDCADCEIEIKKAQEEAKQRIREQKLQPKNLIPEN